MPIGGPFELVDQDGIQVTDKTFAGKPSVIFFGYTSCPDACPMTLSTLSAWLKGIGPDASKLNVLFISLDPERDTSARLKEYLSSFDPRCDPLHGELGVRGLRSGRLLDRGIRYDQLHASADWRSPCRRSARLRLR
jgi:cytochrome oxidase Cu insertion factor (SCO1/SenC/PrrC family)